MSWPGIGHGRTQSFWVLEATAVKAEVGQPGQLIKAGLFQRRVVVGVAVVEADHLVSPGAQRPGGVEADEAGGSGEQDARHCYSGALRPMP